MRALSFAAHISRQSLYPIWNGTAKSISIEMLERLCVTLGADPGGLFRWHRDELFWNVQHLAETRNMALRDLVWSAEILPHSLTPIWQGLQQFVSLETLAKLARALDLDTGDLFAWREMGTERPGLSDEG